LTHLPEHLGILSPTNTFVILENSLGQTRLAELNIANDGLSRKLMCQVVDLPGPEHMFVFNHCLEN
jgi:hypothetical protein